MPIATDGVIRYAHQKLIAEALPDGAYRHRDYPAYVTIPNHGDIDLKVAMHEIHEAVAHDIPTIDHIDANGIDLLVLNGSPWIWFSMGQSDKYQNFLKLKKMLTPKAVFFSGIGSCLPMGDSLTKTSAIIDAFVSEPQNLIDIQQLMGGPDTYVTCRDPLAYYLVGAALKGSTERVDFKVCPSAFAFDYWRDGLRPSEAAALHDITEARSRAAMIYYAPEVGVSADVWQSEPKLRTYRRLFSEFYDEHKPDVYVCTEREMAMAYDQGYQDVTLLRDEYDTFRAVAGRQCIMSGRVHIAMAAAGHVPHVYMISTDTRAATTQVYMEMRNVRNEMARQHQFYVQAFRQLGAAK